MYIQNNTEPKMITAGYLLSTVSQETMTGPTVCGNHFTTSPHIIVSSRHFTPDELVGPKPPRAREE